MSVAAAERKSRCPTSGPIPGILGCLSGTSEKSVTFPTLRFCFESSSALTKNSPMTIPAPDSAYGLNSTKEKVLP